MKKILSVILILCLLLTGCSLSNEEKNNVKQNSDHNEIKKVEENIDNNISENDYVASEESDELIVENENLFFDGFNDKKLLSYIENDICLEISNTLGNEDFIVENVQAIYLSDEYIEELTYNSKENIFFGYTLSELDNKFGEKKYCFTLGDDGTTIVREFKSRDDSFEKMMKNVLIGSGVIVVCVAITYATNGAVAGTMLNTINVMFSMAAKDSLTLASLGIPVGAIVGGITNAIKNDNDDVNSVLQSSLLGATEGFKIGAIVGVVEGVANYAISQYLPKYKEMKAIEDALADPNVPLWRKAELRALKKYEGREQVAFLAGKEVERGVPGATVPDVIHYVDDKLEAIEVKYYNLESSKSLETLYRELVREISARVENLPEGTLQRIVLDVTDRGFTKETVDGVLDKIIEILMPIYPNIPVTIVGL